MIIKKFGKVFFILTIILFIIIIIYSNFFKNNKAVQLQNQETKETKDEINSSNFIKDVKYTTKDADGNEYVITATEGEIDYSNPNILYLSKVQAFIKLVNSEDITISSDFGKYNSENFDTIFSKNVKINYLDNKITGEYLDFSLERNSMLVSKKVIYTNLKNILKADAIDINLKSKDTKIFMLESNKKVNIKSKK
tara:strand:+ start:7482 stop:8066 length:585 start_codon:yes stop_codon:yes gene_type:complete